MKVTKTKWGAIAVVIAVAAGLTWALWPTAEVITPVGPSWASIVFGAAPEKSGIENIYILHPNKGDLNRDLSTQGENIILVITGPDQHLVFPTPGDWTFDIAIAVKAHDDNLAYVTKENVKVEFSGTGTTVAITADNSEDGHEYVFDNVAGTYIRLNVQRPEWKNKTLLADQTFSFVAKLWCWG